MINSESKSDVEVSFNPEKDLSKYDQERDELDNNVGCTVFIFKIYGSVIFLFIWVFIILAIAVVLVIANSGNKIEQSNLRKEREKQEEINELNKTLNE